MAISEFASGVFRAWVSLGVPPPGVVVAVSGGPDSVALALALAECRPDPSTPLVLAHVNHLLRGEESDADAAFVGSLFEQLRERGTPSVSLACCRIETASLAAARGENLEAAARKERYAWLARTARERGLGFVATGHTLDDQAETVLHRLVRGTGIGGLRGIALRRPLEPGVELVRPLLHATREQVTAYLASLGQRSRQDSSNSDRRFTRNRIRHELIPLLRQDYNPRIVEVLGRLAAQAEEAAAAEDEAADEVLRRAERPRAGNLIVLDADTLVKAPRRLLRGALRRVWQRERWPMDAMGFAEWERLADLVAAESGANDLPGGLRVVRQGKVLRVGPAR